MAGPCKHITNAVRGYLREHEGQQVSTSLMVREFGHLTPCKRHVVTILSQLHKEMANLYRVDHGVYVFDRSRKHKEYEGRYLQLLNLAKANDGMVTMDQIIEEMRITKKQAYTLLDQLKHNRVWLPFEAEVERVTVYRIQEKETTNA